MIIDLPWSPELAALYERDRAIVDALARWSVPPCTCGASLGGCDWHATHCRRYWSDGLPDPRSLMLAERFPTDPRFEVRRTFVSNLFRMIHGSTWGCAVPDRRGETLTP